MPAYKDKVRGTWTARFYYKDFTGKSVPKNKRGFKRKSDALKFEREFIEKYEGSANMTYQALYDIYMEMVEPKVKLTTMANKKAALENHVLPHFKDMKIIEIQSINIESWQNDMKEKGLTKNTLETVKRHFSASLNFAVKHFKLPGNPVAVVGSGNTDEHAKHIQNDFWTLDEFNTAMTYYDNNNPLKLIYNLFFYSGLRLGELQALTIKDFDFEKMTVTVNKTYFRHLKKDVIMPPKTPSSNRIVTLPKDIMDHIKEYADNIPGLKSTDRIFEGYSIYTIRKGLRTAAKATGVKKITTHHLRHSHASLLIKLNTPIKAVSERLGHKNINITMNLYAHLYPNEQRDIADNLNNLLGPKHDHEDD